MTEKRPTDWERIEQDYRAGLLSLREIASAHEITEGAIRKRAKRDGWVRDLSAKVRAKADELVRKQEVRELVRTEQAASELITIAASAQNIAQVRIAHRADIFRSRQLVMLLLTELEEMTTQRDDYHQLVEVLHDPEADRSKLEAAFDKAMSLPIRTKTAKDLADALKVLIGLEREAYGIQEEPKKIEHSGEIGSRQLDRSDYAAIRGAMLDGDDV